MFCFVFLITNINFQSDHLCLFSSFTIEMQFPGGRKLVRLIQQFLPIACHTIDINVSTWHGMKNEQQP